MELVSWETSRKQSLSPGLVHVKWPNREGQRERPCGVMWRAGPQSKHAESKFT